MRAIIILLSILSTSNSSGQGTIKDFPKVSVEIKLSDTCFVSSDNIKVTITIINVEHMSQILLFDKPIRKKFPWGTTISLGNNLGISMVKISNMEIISSQLYSEEELEKGKQYYVLEPGHRISHTYNLKDLVILNSNDGKLPKGKYDLQLSYYMNLSNKITFIINQEYVNCTATIVNITPFYDR